MRTFVAVVAFSIFAGLAVGCATDSRPSRPPLAPLPTLTPTPTTSSAPPVVAAHGIPCDDRVALNATLVEAMETAMGEYQGTWSFALYDMECEAMTTVNPEYKQYPASSSKLIPVIAVMRAVEAGSAEFGDVQPLIDGVFMWSSDFDADELETYITAEDLSAVLIDSGVQDGSYIQDSWHHTFMTAADLARVWAALVRGQLLGPDATAFVLSEAALAEIPEEYQTWPGIVTELEGFDFGQKAGYWVSDGVPYDFVGAGYLLDRSDPGASFIPVVFLQAEIEDLFDPQRRAIWPLVVDHIRAVRQLAAPEETATAAVP